MSEQFSGAYQLH